MGRSAQRREGGRRGPRPGDRLFVVRPLGRGGQAEVDLAVRASDQRRVAVKRAHSIEPADRARLRREAEVLLRLADHPGVVGLLEDHSGEAQPFIVLEYVPGGSLKRRLTDGGPVPARVEERWIRQACGTVDILARHGIVHRDLGPANWLLTARDGSLKLADLGIAAGAGMSELTRTNVVVGRPGFLAPEQLRGERATPRSDQWQLAHTLLRLVTRSLRPRSEPLTGRSRVDAVFARALDPDPGRRWPSCVVFGEALISAQGRQAAGRRRRSRRPGAPEPGPRGRSDRHQQRQSRRATRKPTPAAPSAPPERLPARTQLDLRPRTPRGEPPGDSVPTVALLTVAVLLIVLGLLSAGHL